LTRRRKWTVGQRLRTASDETELACCLSVGDQALGEVERASKAAFRVLRGVLIVETPEIDHAPRGEGRGAACVAQQALEVRRPIWIEPEGAVVDRTVALALRDERARSTSPRQTRDQIGTEVIAVREDDPVPVG
jgi:hypothetical protein